MTRTFAARCLSASVAFLLLAVACLAGATAADAQTQTDVPQVVSPLRVEMDANGVNLVSGQAKLQTPALSAPAAPHLRFDWVQNAAPYVSGTLTPGDPPTQSYSVHTGTGPSESFRCVSGDCSTDPSGAQGAVTGTGSMYVGINANIFTQAPTGAVYWFNLKHVDVTVNTTRTILYYVSHVDYPDGETITYTYDTYAPPGDMYNRTFYRPNRVTSNLGYYIAIAYQSDTWGTNDWQTVRQAALYSNADTVNPIGRLTYSGSTITDIAGRVFTCNGCQNALGMKLEVSSGSLTLPGESAPALQMTALASTTSSVAPLVGTVLKDGVSWTYSYANLRLNRSASGWLYDSVTVDGPNGYHNVYSMTPYDINERNVMTGLTDSIGRHTSFSLDALYRPTAVVLPEGNETDVGYGNWGNINIKIDKAKPGSGLANFTETATYNDYTCNPQVLCYRATSSQDALGRETDYVYNNLGQLTEKTEPADANGVRRKTYITYESSSGISRPSVVRICGDISTCGTVDEVRTEYTYWGSTLLPLTESRVDARAGITLTTTSAYDNAGRVLSKDGPLPGTDDALYYRYDVLGRKTWEIGPKGANGLRAAKRFTYRDSDDRVAAEETGTVSDPSSTVLTVLERTDTSYDAHRNATREALSSGGSTYAVTERSFDDRDQLVCQAQRMNPAAFAGATDACTLTAQASYGPDRITHNLYDAAGQLTTIQRAYGTSLQQNYASYEYTPNGKRKALIDANGNRAEMTWDGFDRERRWIFPSPTTPGVANQGDYEEYGYDAASNRTSLRKRDGVTLTYAYDGINRMTAKSVPASASGAAGYSVSYGYDVRGLQTSALFGSGQGITTAYDGFGRITSTTNTMGGFSRTLSYQYDAASNRTRVTHPDGTFFTYEYDAGTAPTAIRENGVTLLASFAYDSAGRRSGLGLAGASTSYGYDAVNRLSSLSHDLAGTAADQNVAFAFNPASQIVSRTSGNDAYAPSTAYNVSRGYSVNGLNEYTAAGGATFTYDANGNLTSDGTNSYVYDAENRLVSRSGGIGLSYDPTGRLFQTSGGTAGTTQFLYDGDALVAEYDAGGNTLRRYVHGTDAVADDPMLWYEGSGLSNRRSLFADHQGSVVAAADVSGSSVGTNAYDAWGIPNSTSIGTVGRFGYTGQAWLPELGMWHYKARIYSPTLGRFLQTDPVGYQDQVNLYAYVGNDPVDHADPSGTHCTGSRIENADGTCGGTGGNTTQSFAPVAVAARAAPTAARATATVAGSTAVAAGTAVAGSLALCGDTPQACRKQADYWYITYTKTKKEGGRTVTYSGRTAGYGKTPQEVLARRDANHHMNAKGFGPARIDRYIHSEASTFGDPTAASAIRGREQQLIDHFGGARRSGGTSGNEINGISPWNPLRPVYMAAAHAYFGDSF